jgi:hypothetical protein
MKIGELDIPIAIINLENDVNVLQQILGFILDKNQNSLVYPTVGDIEKFKEVAFEKLKNKYPSMGLEKTK